jgi:hypothetical protein
MFDLSAESENRLGDVSIVDVSVVFCNLILLEPVL